MQRTTYLIDSENVNDAWVRLLPQLEHRDRIIIFYTENSPHFTVESARVITEYKDRDLTWKKCFAGRNALDFQLVSQMGYIISKYPQDSYAIMSNDTGFDAAVKYWIQEGIAVSRIRGNGKAVTGSLAEAVKERGQAGSLSQSEERKQPRKEGAALPEKENIGGKRPVSEKKSVLKEWFIRWFSESRESVRQDIQGQSVDDVLTEEAVGSAERTGKSQKNKSAGGNRSSVYAAKKRLQTKTVPKNAVKTHEGKKTSERLPGITESSVSKEAAGQAENVLVGKLSTAVKGKGVQQEQLQPDKVPAAELSTDVKETVKQRESGQMPEEAQSGTNRKQEERQPGKIQKQESCQPEKTQKQESRQSENQQQEIPVKCVIGLCRSIPIRKQEKIHEALVALLGGENGREVYRFLKENREFHEKLATIYLEDKDARINNYLKVIFEYNDLKSEQMEDIRRLLGKYQSKDLNGLYRAMTGCFGKNRGSQYYNILKPHVRVIKKL